MQPTASKPVVHAWSVCRLERMLRGMHIGLAAADLSARYMSRHVQSSTARRIAFAVLLAATVLTIAVQVVISSLGPDTGVRFLVALWSLRVGTAAMTLLWVWSAVYVRVEPALVRVVLICAAVLLLLLTIAAHTWDGRVG